MAGLIKELQKAFPKQEIEIEIAESALDAPKSYGVPVLLYLKELERSHGEKFKTDTVKNAVNQLCEHYRIASFETVTPKEVVKVEKVDVLRVQIKARDSKTFTVETILCNHNEVSQFSFTDEISFKTLTPNKEKRLFIQALRKALNNKKINYERVLVEFAVEKIEYLNFSFHKWTDECDIALGSKYRVTVRLATRELWMDCQHAWEKAKTKCQTCSGHLFTWIDQLNPSSNVNNHFGIAFKRKPTKKELELFDNHGIAIAIWSNQVTEDYQNIFSDLLKDQSFTTVPQIIRDFRANHVDDDITLFWDEPERINLNSTSQSKKTTDSEKEYFHAP